MGGTGRARGHGRRPRERSVEDTSWLERARCRGHDPEQFFVRGVSQARPALRICQRCQVKDDCLRYAIENDIDFGVWGGLTERQRRAHQRRYAAAS